MSLEDIVVWSCPACGFRAQKPAGEFTAVFHPCRSRDRRARRRADHDLVAAEEDRRTEWARGLLGPIAEALETEIGADAWYEEE